MKELLQISGKEILGFLFDLLIALIILTVSFKIIKIISRKVEKRLLNSIKLDKTLVKTLVYLVRIAVKALIVTALVGFIGVDTSGFAALLTSLGVGIGLAVNGALSNFAGGALLLLTRPFVVDDYIEAVGISGTVEDIHIINTRLRTPDNKIVYIPNGILSSATIINYSAKDVRRVDLLFRIDGECDLNRAKAIISDCAASNPMVLSDPPLSIKLKSQGKSALPIILRAFVKNEDYWTVYYDLTEQIKAALDKEKIGATNRVISIETE